MYKISVTDLENGEHFTVSTGLFAIAYIDRTSSPGHELAAACALNGTGNLKETVGLALGLERLLDKVPAHPTVRKVYEVRNEVISQTVVDVSSLGLGAMDQEAAP